MNQTCNRHLIYAVAKKYMEKMLVSMKFVSMYKCSILTVVLAEL